MSEQSQDNAAEAFVAACEETASLLESIVDNRRQLAHLDPELRLRLLMAAGRVSKPDDRARVALKREMRKRDKVRARTEDRALLARTGIRTLRDNPIFETPRRTRNVPTPHAPPPLGTLHNARACYVCHVETTEVHGFYDQMCLPCGDFNFAKRHPQGDLSGRIALVTGARVKIGYQAAIMLLRAGAHVIVTTRFARDAARRYAAESDFDQWGHRLEVWGLDLRHTPNVQRFCDDILGRHSRLDLIINNACQTVRRPPGFYGHLMAAELEDHGLSKAQAALIPRHEPVPLTAELPPAALSQVPLIPGDEDRSEALFPAGELDADLQQVDLREMNSWRLEMADVSTVELLEVHLVNAVAPYLLNARLKPLLAAVPTNDAHVVNVSAMEGQFYKTFKSSRHPHTNMAKAALNMMTRTAALDYIEAGIHMNSVDTGWVTDEDPARIAAMKAEVHGFSPPLDIVDGAARIVDPFFAGLATGKHVWGQFLKDYKVTDW